MSKAIVILLGNEGLSVYVPQLFQAIRLFCIEPELSPSSINPPLDAYYRTRKQYDASRLVGILASQIIREKGDKLLIFTNVDLFVPGLNFVFGLADPSREAAILSVRRLVHEAQEDTRLVEERVYKEAVHELGHLFHLQHCQDRRCIMAFANSILDVDLKQPKLCGSCKSRLGLE